MQLADCSCTFKLQCTDNSCTCEIQCIDCSCTSELQYIVMFLSVNCSILWCFKSVLWCFYCLVLQGVDYVWGVCEIVLIHKQYVMHILWQMNLASLTHFIAPFVYKNMQINQIVSKYMQFCTLFTFLLCKYTMITIFWQNEILQ